MNGTALSYEIAMALIDAAVAAARQTRVRVAIAVVDASGELLAGARMDDVHPLNLEVARRKAVAASALGGATHDIADFADGDKRLQAGFAALGDRMVLLPGGFPVTRVTTLVGGFGVAGGHYSQDRTIGETALGVIAPSLAG